MIEKAPILLIDDNDESSQNLRTVLAFLGESIMPVNTAAWVIQVEES